MNIDNKEKYLKYKGKYLLTKAHQGGTELQMNIVKYLIIYWSRYELTKLPKYNKFISMVDNIMNYIDTQKTTYTKDKITSIQMILINPENSNELLKLIRLQFPDRQQHYHIFLSIVLPTIFTDSLSLEKTMNFNIDIFKAIYSSS